MRYCITVLMLLPLFVSAQDCKLKKGIDDMTSRPTLSTGFIGFDDFSLSMDANSKEIDFFFLVKVGSRCFDDENTIVTVNFEGKNQRQTYKNAGGTNCDGTLHVIFKNLAYTNSGLTKLATKKAVSIVFTDSNGKMNAVSLSPQQQQALMEYANCISVQAKTLIGQ